MVESYAQSRFLFSNSTVVSFQNVTCAFLELDKDCIFTDILRLYLPKKIAVRFYISSIISDQAAIEGLFLDQNVSL